MILVSSHLQKNIFAAARMRFIFVTRCAGNKAIFFFGLITNDHPTMTGDMAWWKTLNTLEPLVINHNSTLMDVIGETGNHPPVSAVRVPRVYH